MQHPIAGWLEPFHRERVAKTPESRLRCLRGLAYALLAGAGLALGASVQATEPEDATEISEDQLIEKSSPSFYCGISPAEIPYCSYIGPVRLTYVNATGLILVYPDSAISAAEIEAAMEAVGYEQYWGQDVHSLVAFAVAVPIDDTDPATYRREKFFADKAYLKFLAVQLTDQMISVQMRGAYQGYLRIDRTWLMGS